MDFQLPSETWVSASTWPIETALGGILDASIVGYLSTEVSTLNNISRIIERNITDEIDPFYFYQTEQFTVLWLLFSVIVVGNTSVLVGLIFGKRRKSRMNFFIKQLAFADLMVGLISVLTDIVWRSTVAWYAGNVACKIIRFMQVVVTYSSTYVLVALSIDRYDAITRPMNFSRSWCRARALVTAAWSISVLFSVPIIFLYEERIVEGKNQCWIELGSPANWRIYMTVVCLTLFIIPAIIIGGCYMVIVWTIWSQSSALRHDPTRDTRRASSRGLIPRAKIKTVKMTFVIVFVFILCWSPYIVFDLLQVYGHVPRSQTNIAVATFIQSLAPLNSAANPIIYCLFSTPFCKTVRPLPI
ncbi:cardioacceleratory peptide receptor isoform X2 [Nasonia vitripennis]|uniref:G-protein coupled receptors family 1 profile domain-containing protein n=1 Tax=Nasonia vitripennis TaxID=7425 RepID=A0A7M7PZ50_NASVI|nr:cardioacceleratory peptide receptor isoform X2 [Nasonia vitripennis]